MALSLKHRHTIFERLAPTLGEEETEALLSQFPPPHETSPSPTTASTPRSPASGPTSPTSSADFADLRADFADLKADVSHMEAALVERMRQQLMWTFGAMVSGLGVGMGIAAAISQAIG